MYTDPADWPEGDLHGIVMSDYISSEVMDGIVPHKIDGTTFTTESDSARATLAGYGDRPSRAWFRTARQFTLIKAHDMTVAPALFGLVHDLITEAERLAQQYGSSRDQVLVRGLEVHRAGKVLLHLDMICATGRTSPYLSLQVLQTQLERYAQGLGGMLANLKCKIHVVVGEAEATDPLDDRYYDRVRAVIGW